MDKFEFYKELYHKENERRTEVLNSMNIPIAIISALSTALYFVITNFDYKIETFLSYIFCGLCAAAIICILFAIYYLIRAFSNFTKGYEYSGIPYPNELFNWYNELVEHYTKNNGTAHDAENHFKDYLTSNFTKHTDHNMFVNDKKYEHIYMSKKYLITGLIVTLFLMLPFGYNYFNKNEPIHKIQISNQPTVPNDLLEIRETNEKLEQTIQFNQLKTNQNEREREKTDTTPATPTTPTGQIN